MPTVGRLRSPRLTSPPASPAQGEMYFDTGANKLYWWSGTAWVDASGGSAPPEVFTGSSTPPGSQVLWIDTGTPAPALPSVLDYNHPLVLPPGVFAQSIPRFSATSTLSATSGQLRLMAVVVPGGRQITKAFAVTTQAGSSLTNQWACLVRFADLTVLSTSADLGAAAQSQGGLVTFTGLNYTPAADELLYVGVVMVGGAPWFSGASYSGSTNQIGPAVDIPPLLVANSNMSGLTTPASLGATAAALSYYNQLYWVGVGA